MFEIDEIIDELKQFLPLEVWWMIRKYLFWNIVEKLERELKFYREYDYVDNFLFNTRYIALGDQIEVTVDDYSGAGSRMICIAYSWNGERKFEMWN